MQYFGFFLGLSLLLIWVYLGFKKGLFSRISSSLKSTTRPYEMQRILDEYVESRYVASSYSLAELIESMDEEDLKRLIVAKIRAGITHEQYDFFNGQLATDYLNLLHQRCIKDDSREKVSKLQWISRG